MSLETMMATQGDCVRLMRYLLLFVIGMFGMFSFAYLSSCLLYDRVPFTKWCGKGGVATSMQDMGLLVEVDRCCQEHDQCPLFIHANQTDFGVSNPSRYTMSDCRCDDRFHLCLIKITRESLFFERLSAILVGIVYFDVIKLSCLQFPNKKSESADVINSKTFIAHIH